MVGVVEADGEELARLDRRGEPDGGQRQPVLAPLADLADALQDLRAAREQLVPGRVQRAVGGDEVHDVVAHDDGRPDAAGGVKRCEPHCAAPHSLAKRCAKSG